MRNLFLFGAMPAKSKTITSFRRVWLRPEQLIAPVHDDFLSGTFKRLTRDRAKGRNFYSQNFTATISKKTGRDGARRRPRSERT
jgi:hypothetical protein